jgi:hypothetical protein
MLKNLSIRRMERTKYTLDSPRAIRRFSTSPSFFFLCLKTLLDMISPEYFRIVEEQRVEEEQRLQAIRDLERQIKAVTTIQSIWRGYLVRRWFKKKKAKKTRTRRGGGGGGAAAAAAAAPSRVRPGTAATTTGTSASAHSAQSAGSPTTAVSGVKAAAGAKKTKGSSAGVNKQKDEKVAKAKKSVAKKP